jgi:hypothetical protein
VNAPPTTCFSVERRVAALLRPCTPDREFSAKLDKLTLDLHPRQRRASKLTRGGTQDEIQDGTAAMAKEELKWQNIDADDLPAAVKKSFDAMVEAEAAFKTDLEKLLKQEGHMPGDKFLVMSRKGKRLGVAFASTPRGEGGAGSLKFKAK